MLDCERLNFVFHSALYNRPVFHRVRIVQAILILPGLLLIFSGTVLAAPGEELTNIRRIISTAPSITETIFALGQGEKLVGATTYCDYPPAAKKLPRIGDFASPNVEVILSLTPDLVVLLDSRQDIRQKLQPFSLPLFAVKQESLSSILQSIDDLAELLGREEAGKGLIARIEGEITSVRNRVKQLSRRPRVLILVGRNQGSLSNLYAVGAEGFLGELVRLAGGLNIFSDSRAQYPKVSFETILARKPEVIIDMSFGQPNETNRKEARRLWQKFPNIPAVRNERVVFTSNDVLLLPGPRIGEAVESLASLIHGEDF